MNGQSKMLLVILSILILLLAPLIRQGQGLLFLMRFCILIPILTLVLFFLDSPPYT